MDIQTISYPGSGSEVPASLCEPSTPASAAVIVLHQAGGMSDQVSTWLELLTTQGYLAVAPHLFHRKGTDRAPKFTDFAAIEDFDRWLEGDAGVAADLDSTIEFLGSRSIGVDSVGVLGFSYGGRAAFLAATRHSVGAAVTYYGNGIQSRSFGGNDDLLPLSSRPLLAPWLGLYGVDDFLLTPGELDALAEAVEPQGGSVVRYADAGHGFDVSDDHAGNAAAAPDAKQRTLAFLAERLKQNS